MRRHLRSSAIRQPMRDHLSALPFPAFLECMCHLLCALGYMDVRRIGRAHWRGRTAQGGLDLQAWAQTGVTRTKVLVQVKRYDRPVHRRFVDELRGAMLRLGAGQGLLLTTSTFAKAARRAALSDNYHHHLAPIRLVDGEELLDWLLAYQVGVRKVGQDHWMLDEAFFARLRWQYPDRGRQRRRLHQIDSEPQEKAGQDRLLFQLTLGSLTLTLTRSVRQEER